MCDRVFRTFGGLGERQRTDDARGTFDAMERRHGVRGTIRCHKRFDFACAVRMFRLKAALQVCQKRRVAAQAFQSARQIESGTIVPGDSRFGTYSTPVVAPGRRRRGEDARHLFALKRI
jgi:hypothetical protein